MLKFLAVIPDTQSAIRIGGGRGDLTKVTLDCYLNGEQIERLASYRGEELEVVIGTRKTGGVGDG